MKDSIRTVFVLFCKAKGHVGRYDSHGHPCELAKDVEGLVDVVTEPATAFSVIDKNMDDGLGKSQPYCQMKQLRMTGHSSDSDDDTDKSPMDRGMCEKDLIPGDAGNRAATVLSLGKEFSLKGVVCQKVPKHQKGKQFESGHVGLPRPHQNYIIGNDEKECIANLCDRV